MSKNYYKKLNCEDEFGRKFYSRRISLAIAKNQKKENNKKVRKHNQVLIKNILDTLI